MCSSDLVERVDKGVIDTKDMSVVQAFLNECNEYLEKWAAAHPFAELAAGMARSGAVHGAVFDVTDIVNNEHYQARGDLVRVEDGDFGSVLMQGVIPKFAGREHKVNHAGRALGADNAEVYGRYLGYDEAQLQQLKKEGVL